MFLRQISFLLIFVLLSSPAIAFDPDFLAGIGIAYPFESNRGHTTTTEAGYAELTQYLFKNDWGSIGLRESFWGFTSLGAYGWGVGPAGEIRFKFHEDGTAFITASGSVGTSNMEGKLPEVTGQTQFGGQIGIGVELAQHVRVELRYQHLSNGGTAYPNAGLDMLTPVLSWKF